MLAQALKAPESTAYCFGDLTYSVDLVTELFFFGVSKSCTSFVHSRARQDRRMKGCVTEPQIHDKTTSRSKQILQIKQHNMLFVRAIESDTETFSDLVPLLAGQHNFGWGGLSNGRVHAQK